MRPLVRDRLEPLNHALALFPNPTKKKGKLPQKLLPAA